MLVIEAPKTFLIPISFVFCSVVKEMSPNNPRHEIIIASREKLINAFSNLSSDLY